ncbi:type VI secretion system ATPase TssH [Xanthomonas citri pv. fuscans CFBP 6996]|uniref:type VI secretion system ATPase TssH n=1 Tax=Xanthomonas citri TaxID=346 RepID=UPI000C17C379|nr:type VI secretion system ATPase TssH [Xanthomonas citri]ATS49628.1 type VI secretion system ATPase TssH [Xanthomonas citri pv. phaseoli var. fuscans]ATS55364.1 type VI secretion system ATPase TssH [Xanthomonas citri pv. phaseoli var. fuscans]ATS60624.1 type VI secretion system ATPase TssH [Xanthomonas citri pv. phaseoli var. fuscans]PTY28762.1 type VI secretion system ATPase TssH [Xanthomonas citri pv. fuscans CFBP 6996]QWN18107.1 type VI secretion system ATPase TssH [Xanthomonas citri]
MAEISRSALFGKLNPLAYRGIESATVFCKLRGNPDVELVHWLHQLLQLQDSDLHRIIKHFQLNPSTLARDVTAALDGLPRGSTAVTDLSANVEEAVERGWVYASLSFGEAQVRTGYLVVGMLSVRGLRHALLTISKEFDKLKPAVLNERFAEIVAGSPEDGLLPSDGFSLGQAAAPGETSGAIAPAALGKQEALKKFTTDLTAQAREGKLDPIIGRDDEIRQVVDILMRRRQNNPILVGEAGVGKTAVVEGFAQRIARGDVPPALKDVQLCALDVGLLQAGASMKGEFEQRLRAVIDEVQASPKPIILFVDETHTLVGAGGAAGTGDAANLLKPALARGTLRTVGATTFAEYKKYIEKDPALTRRFQAVQVDEPDEAKAVRMMRGVASMMEQHHRVQILDEALEASVKLSHRYIPARQLPDKSVSLLDTACARVAVSLHATPAEVDDSRRRIESLDTEQAIIERERAIGIVVDERAAACAGLLDVERSRLQALEQRWVAEKALVDELLSLRAQLRNASAPVEGTGSALEAEANAEQIASGDTAVLDAPVQVDRDTLLARLQLVQAELAALQGESPLILPTVDYQAVAAVVADWTGIPVGRMARNEIDTVLRLPELLAKRVIGQDHAMEMIAKRIQTSRAGLDNPDKPIGVFLLAGTSGVGKTETALALAETLYGGEQNLITINMSEYQEAHTVSSLKGAPPGYVGYGEGGVLTEAVRRKPYSVVLLDEVEKAHPDVHELFFQVFDKGWMEDGEGRRIDFRNTLIILTSNAGTDLIASLCKDPELMPDPEGMATALRELLLKVFPPALLGRLVAIPYYPLSNTMLGQIVRLQLNRIKKRIEERYRIPFEYDESVVELVVSRCTESESGGRMIDAILTNSMLPEISRKFLRGVVDRERTERLDIRAEESALVYSFL